MATLIITLPLDMPASGMEWDYVLSEDGQTIARQGRAAAALLPALSGAGHDIVAVAPVRALSWRRVSLPPSLLARPRLQGGVNPQLRAALEGLLEEQLLDEPASLHLALAPRPFLPTGAGAETWVAACDKAWLQTHLQVLEEHRHAVTRIVPEFEPAADDASAALHVISGTEHGQLVHTDTRGVTVLPLGTTAAQWLDWPEEAPIVAESSVAKAAETLFKRPVTLKAAHERWLESARSDWNLAQFDLARLGHARLLKQLARHGNALRHAPQWRAARWLMLALLGVQLLGVNALAWRERTLLVQKQQTIRQLLQQTFPDIQLVVDAPLQMERQLSAMQQSTGAASPRDLDSMLNALASAAPATLALAEINYNAGEARLRGPQLSGEDVSQLQNRLLPLGYDLRAEGDAWLLRAEGGQESNGKPRGLR